MRRSGFWQSRRAVVAVVAAVVLLAGAAVFALVGNGGGADLASTPNGTSPSGSDSESPLESTSTPTPTPTSSATPTGPPTCEGPDTQFNVEGVEQASLLPNCGETPVTAQQQAANGLGLACGGSYPVILYKTRTADTTSSICGVDSSGQKLRVVVAVDGEPTRDLQGSYEYQLDAFVADDGNTTYIVQAYDGSVVIQRGDGTRTEESLDWISLDNESDGEAEYIDR